MGGGDATVGGWGRAARGAEASEGWRHGRSLAWLGWGVAATLLSFGALRPAPPPVPAHRAENHGLADRLSSLETTVGKLDRLATRIGEPERLERLSETDDWTLAVDTGILRAVVQARTGLSPSREAQLAAAIVRESRESQLDPLLVTALVAVESGFRLSARSPKGAIGLMQVMPRTAAEVAQQEALPPGHELDELDQNLALGCRYLAKLTRHSPSLEAALVAYNMGPSAARLALRGPRAKALLAGYPGKVLGHYRALRRAAGPIALASATPAE